MEPDEHAHQQTILHELIRRKQIREEQLAELGISADPAIRLEIEDLAQQIDTLRQALAEVAPHGDPLQASVSAPPPSVRHTSALRETLQFYRGFAQFHEQVWSAMGWMYWSAVYGGLVGGIIGAFWHGLTSAYLLSLAGGSVAGLLGWVKQPSSAVRIVQARRVLVRIIGLSAVVGGVAGALVGAALASRASAWVGAAWGALVGLWIGCMLSGVTVYNQQ